MIINKHIRRQYDILIKHFSEIDTSATFFDSFKQTYGAYYLEWLKKKVDDLVFVTEQCNEIVAFMKLKMECENEDYSDICPEFTPKRRLKICSFKIAPGFPGLSSQYFEIITFTALRECADEIYATIAFSCSDRDKLIDFFTKREFFEAGIKESHGVKEIVIIRKMGVTQTVDS